MNYFRSAGLAAIIASLSVGACFAEGAVTHRLLAQDKGHLVILDEKGQVTWEAPCGGTAHDLAMLPNGNILYPPDSTTIVEMTPDKKVVWKHVSRPKAGYHGGVEIHGFQRLDSGLTMVAESGNMRIIEVDKDDNIVHETPITVEHEEPHRDTRLVRKLDNGHYLACHEGDGMVREYNPDGKVVWSYKLDLDNRPEAGSHQGHGTHVFSAIRLPNGNTMIGCGDGNRVIEVTPEGKEVWRIGFDELPGIRLFWITTLELLPNGNLVVGNTHAGPENPQMFEVTRDKKVVWTLKNFDVLGNDLAAAEILDVPGKVIR